MRAEDFRALLHQRPFVPFRLITTNNLSFEIRHPEMVNLSRSILQIAKPGAEGGLFEYVVGLALLQIVQFELLPPAS
jgi:hypothetical protein